MNFDFSPEQEEFRDQLRRFLQKADGPGQARSVLDNKVQNYSALIWHGLADLSVQAIAIPEEHSGLGLGALELCVAAEELGRALAPVPFLSSICVCAEAIRLFGSDGQQAKWLPGLASGSIIGTWAFADDTGDDTRFHSGTLSGTKALVLDGMIARLSVVVTKDAAGAPVLSLCDLAQSRVERQPVKTVDPTRPAARVKFDGAAAELLPRCAGGGWQKLSDRAAVLLAFEQLGSAESSLAMASAYARERGAFGRKISSFQAIKHKLVQMYTKIQLARCHCYYGAWAISTDAVETPVAAAAARCSAIDALDFAAQENIQVHGGIGVTWESNCHLFYRRARLNALLLGSRYEWQDRLVASLERELV
jgi:alkylation response protein AidB-like acyl-CoA dehydrogenase